MSEPPSLVAGAIGRSIADTAAATVQPCTVADPSPAAEQCVCPASCPAHPYSVVVGVNRWAEFWTETPDGFRRYR